MYIYTQYIYIYIFFSIYTIHGTPPHGPPLVAFYMVFAGVLHLFCAFHFHNHFEGGGRDTILQYSRSLGRSWKSKIEKKLEKTKKAIFLKSGDGSTAKTSGILCVFCFFLGFSSCFLLFFQHVYFVLLHFSRHNNRTE